MLELYLMWRTAQQTQVTIQVIGEALHKKGEFGLLKRKSDAHDFQYIADYLSGCG